MKEEERDLDYSGLNTKEVNEDMVPKRSSHFRTPFFTVFLLKPDYLSLIPFTAIFCSKTHTTLRPSSSLGCQTQLSWADQWCLSLFPLLAQDTIVRRMHSHADLGTCFWCSNRIFIRYHHPAWSTLAVPNDHLYHRACLCHIL